MRIIRQRKIYNPQVACYKNKLSSWRSGIETDLDEVLQVHDVFVDVVNGKRAKRNEVLQAFELGDLDAVRFPFRCCWFLFYFAETAFRF